MMFAKFSLELTKAANFQDRKSRIGIRPDGSVRESLEGLDWTLRKAECLSRDGFRCVVCGGLMDLDPHHKVHRGTGGGDDLENLEIRCRGCHNAAHPEKQVKWSKAS